MTLPLFLRASALLWGTTIAAALVVATLPGAAPALRDAFGFRLDAAEPGSMSDAASYFTTNLRVVAALMLAGWARSRCSGLAPLLDVLAGAVIVINAAIVGAALGAYGTPAVRWLPHLPLEWAAFALASTAYSAGLSARTRLRAASVAAAALVLAAFVESSNAV